VDRRQPLAIHWSENSPYRTSATTPSLQLGASNAPLEQLAVYRLAGGGVHLDPISPFIGQTLQEAIGVSSELALFL
jgi:hypothetical protein